MVFNRDNFRAFLFVIVGLALCLTFSNIMKSCSQEKKEQVVIEQLTEEVKNNETKVELVEENGKIQLDAVVDNHKKEEVVKKDVKDRIEKSDKKVEEIKKVETTTQLEKDIAVSDALIDDLWESFCATKGASCPAT